MNISVDVLRLDAIHPVASGNKCFKLKYYLQNAIQLQKKGLVSFGGAYSNHLVALAHRCSELGLHSIGIIRGEEQQNNESITQMRSAGMQLHFVSRQAYINKEGLVKEMDLENYSVVPEGGRGLEGIKGAEEILTSLQNDYSHIACAVGTGTTLAGLVNASLNGQIVLGIPVLKISDQQNNEISGFLQSSARSANWTLLYDYHFGGYAKHTPQLLAFMNDFHERENIPSDFVYTGKLFYAADDLVKKGYFPSGSNVLLIHTGGLQGNRSLSSGQLTFR